MALSGVRSSWLMLARNCDLCWLASASCRLLSWISSNSRTFSMAITAWSAKVVTSSIGLNVGDMNRFAFKQNSPGDRASVWLDGAIFHVLVVFPWCATTRDVKERRALWAQDGRHLGLAKLGD